MQPVVPHPPCMQQAVLHVLLLCMLWIACASQASCDQSSSRLMPARSLLAPKPCKKLLWFTAIAGKHTRQRYSKYLRVAMTSKLQKAPSLVPHLIWSGDDNSGNMLEWYTKNGGTVHHHNLTFYSKLQDVVAAGHRDKAWIQHAGAYLRLDLPVIFDKMKITDPNIETSYLLYTDADVIFFRDITSCDFPKPTTMALGGETKRGTRANSGVLVVNMDALRQDHQPLIAWGEANHFKGIYDQTIILEYYKDRLEQLPDRYNWKGYWGRSDDIVILHLHGPKPDRCLDCLVVNTALRMGVEECECHRSYLLLWKMSPDKGQLYEDALLLFYRYLLISHGVA